MQHYIKYILSLVLIFSNLSVAFSMHLCQGVIEEIKLNHLDNNSCEMEVAKSCCPPKLKENHCEIPQGETQENDDCCQDISYSDKVLDKQIVKVLKLVPINFVASEVLQIQIPQQNSIKIEVANYLDSYVESNAPPNYILNSQLTFYEG